MALAAFHDKPGLLGVALVIYGLGLRHAVDADHIFAWGISYVIYEARGLDEFEISATNQG